MAIAPALIIGMVACLVFFLVIAFYRGDYDVRLMYLLGLFTLATVLIARIAIDSGRAYANIFSLPLALVSLLAMVQFVRIQGPLGPISWLVNGGLLAVAWYLADRITFDCTLVDERNESKQEGLLQSLGLLHRDEEASSSEQQSRPKKKPEGDNSKKANKHNPGVWVLYFSLLAFPLFGIGQLVIPDETERNRAFAFLIGYLACALCLLVTTSFLGMRRYLRQKGIAMPGDMNQTWLGMGVVGVVVILVLCLIMPLPGHNLGVVGPPFSFESPDLSTSRFGWGNEGEDESDSGDSAVQESEDGPQTGEARRDAKGNPKGSSDAADDASSTNSDKGPKGNEGQGSQDSGKGDESQGQQSGEDGKQSDANTGDREQGKSGESGEGGKNDSDDAGEGEGADGGANESDRNDADGGKESDSGTPSQGGGMTPLSQLTGAIPAFLNWLIIIILVAIIVIYLITHPKEVARLLRDLRAMLAGLFGWRRRVETTEEVDELEQVTPPKPVRPFSDFQDPFMAQLKGWSPAAVVEYTFAALESFGAERGARRGEDQTAFEYAEDVGDAVPIINTTARKAAAMHDRLLFAGWKPTQEDLQPLAKLWKMMRQAR